MDQTKLMMKKKKEAPRKKALTDEMSFSGCRFWAYSKTRLGWPSNPTRKSGKNVKLKKMKNVQKCHALNLRFIVLPVILGIQ